MKEVLNEETLDQEVNPTEEVSYDEEYDKAWGDSSEVVSPMEDEEEESLEQSDNESEVTDEKPEDEVVENSKDKDIDEPKESKDSDVEKEFAQVLKWKGKEIPVTMEELIALGQKGFDSEKKWQEAAINRPVRAIIDKYGLTLEQLEMLGNITKDRNAEALALLAEQSNIDLYDAERRNYKPVVENRNYELDDVLDEINRNEEQATLLNDYVSSVPQSVKDLFIKDPSVLRALNEDATKGIAQRIMPEVIKQYALNPNREFVSLYQEVGHKVFSQVQQEPKAEESKPEVKVATREDKKRVAVNKSAPTQEKSVVDDYDAAWDDDKHFEAVKRRLAGF